jgi:hypothetical protein
MRPWRLRCSDVTGVEELSTVSERVIACALVEPVYTEGLGYTVLGVLDGEPMLLGAGPGLVVHYSQDDMGALAHDDVRVTLSPEPIADDAWITP